MKEQWEGGRGGEGEKSRGDLAVFSHEWRKLHFPRASRTFVLPTSVTQKGKKEKKTKEKKSKEKKRKKDGRKERTEPAILRS